jgi:K+-transporting ATPase A subunit
VLLLRGLGVAGQEDGNFGTLMHKKRTGISWSGSYAVPALSLALSSGTSLFRDAPYSAVRYDHDNSSGRASGKVYRLSEARRRSRMGTSWTSVVLGWFAALGASLFLSGIVGAIVGAILAALGTGDLGTAGGSIWGFVGLLLALLIAFFIGGYVAGRMASRSGIKHGLLVPLLSLVITLVLVLMGVAVNASLIDQLSGVTLPGPVGMAAQSVPQQDLTTILSVSGILALLFPFIGGALGGGRGATVGRRRP